MYAKLILAIDIPINFSKFVRKLLKCYCKRMRTKQLLSDIKALKSDRKLRKFITSKLTLPNIEDLVHALHYKDTYQIADEQSNSETQPILEINESIIENSSSLSSGVKECIASDSKVLSPNLKNSGKYFLKINNRPIPNPIRYHIQKLQGVFITLSNFVQHRLNNVV